MKSVKTIAAIVALGALGFLSWRANQKPKKHERKPMPTRVVDVEARRILEKADAASRAAKVVRYNASYHVRGSDRSITGLVQMNSAKEWLSIKSAHVGPNPSGQSEYQTATDGETVFHISYPDKKYMHGPFLYRSFLPRRGSELTMGEFGDDNPFGEELKGSITLEDQKPVGDVLCDVVYVKYESDGEHARWFIGPDGLPRKVERLSNMYPDLPPEAKAASILTVTNLEIDPSLKQEDFRLTRPEGYEDLDLVAGIPTLPTGSAAPDWTLETPAGESVSLKSLRGNVVVMDFWGTWCPACLLAMPEIQKVHEHFEGQPVRVLGISCGEKEHADPAGYMKSKKYTYTLLLKGMEVASAFAVIAFPTYYVIDPEGNVASMSIGGGNERELMGIIENLLPTARTASIESGL